MMRNDVQAALSKYEGAASERHVRASKRVANTAPTPVTGPKKQTSVPMVKKGAVAAVTPGAPKPMPHPVGHNGGVEMLLPTILTAPAMPQYFEFGKSLLQVIVNSLGMKHFDIIGSDAMNKLRVYIEKNMESVTRQFLECDESFTAISRKEKEAIFNPLVKKTCNA
jgi:hypothetical protein